MACLIKVTVAGEVSQAMQDLTDILMRCPESREQPVPEQVLQALSAKSSLMNKWCLSSPCHLNFCTF